MNAEQRKRFVRSTARDLTERIGLLIAWDVRKFKDLRIGDEVASVVVSLVREEINQSIDFAVRMAEKVDAEPPQPPEVDYRNTMERAFDG